MERMIPTDYDAVILAAGCGSRFKGRTYKLLEPIQGVPMIRRTAETALQACFREVIVVGGYRAEETREALKGLKLRFIRNDDWEKGQSASMLRGILSLKPGSGGVCFILADQPFVRPDTLKKICLTAARHPEKIIAPGHEGKRGNPCLFPSSYYPALLNVSGDLGGREVLRKAGFFLMETDDPGIFLDIDTVEDIKK